MIELADDGLGFDDGLGSEINLPLIRSITNRPGGRLNLVLKRGSYDYHVTGSLFSRNTSAVGSWLAKAMENEPFGR